MPFVNQSSQPCGNIEMCGPCWKANPEQQWAMCNTVLEVFIQSDNSHRTIERGELQGILGDVCSRVTGLVPDTVMETGVEERLLQQSIEIHPRRVMLTDVELAE